MEMTMTKLTFAMFSAALLAGTAHAAPPAQPINDRVEALCAVSDLDMVGKRLARECRAQLRAQHRASAQATSTAQKSEKLPSPEARMAQLPK